MRDIPMFTTENGVASLYLKNISYTKTAYIHIRDASEPELLLKDCCDFCVAAGAQYVIATGHSVLVQYDVYTSILKMKCENSFQETDASIFPVQEETMEQWRNLYNEKMKHVPNAALISFHEAKKYLSEGNCYFIHKNGALLGIGVAGGNRIDAVASLLPGAGREVLIALCKAISGDVIELEVADNNSKAIALYQSMGFIATETVETWYKII